MAELSLALIMLGLTAYAVFGGADLGAGFWDLTAGGAARGGRVRGMVQRSMSPVWEANHVWLIFVLVIFWTAFPTVFGSVMSTLYIPLVLAGTGLILRGVAFAVRGQAATIAEARALGAMFALSSILVPFFLGAAIGAIASGRVPLGNAAGEAFGSWLNPTSLFVGTLAIAIGAFLSAVFLAGDSVRAGFPDLQRAFRLRALLAGAVSGALAIGGLPIIRSDAPALYDGLTSVPGVVAVAVSAAAGIATLALVLTQRFGPARVTASAAVAAITAGWALAQSPYVLPDTVTLEEAAASDATLAALLASVAAGMVLLVPSLVYLYRLVLRGTLDQEFEPLDQRFRPMDAGDDEDRRR
jgi:cytochrome bd ubiquinol oxidase subunit II